MEEEQEQVLDSTSNSDDCSLHDTSEKSNSSNPAFVPHPKGEKVVRKARIAKKTGKKVSFL